MGCYQEGVGMRHWVAGVALALAFIFGNGRAEASPGVGDPIYGAKAQKDDRELTLAVVGIQFDNADGSNLRFEIKLCSPGDPSHLHRQPKNPHSQYALAVSTERVHQIGYLTAERAPWIGAKLVAGEEWIADFQGMTASAAYVRVWFWGRAPSLPFQRERPPTWSEVFHPDPEGPERRLKGQGQGCFC